jgi:hypothetical protein
MNIKFASLAFGVALLTTTAWAAAPTQYTINNQSDYTLKLERVDETGDHCGAKGTFPQEVPKNQPLSFKVVLDQDQCQGLYATYSLFKDNSKEGTILFTLYTNPRNLTAEAIFKKFRKQLRFGDTTTINLNL